MAERFGSPMERDHQRQDDDDVEEQSDGGDHVVRISLVRRESFLRTAPHATGSHGDADRTVGAADGTGHHGTPRRLDSSPLAACAQIPVSDALDGCETARADLV